MLPMCSSWEVEEEDRAVRKSRLDRLLDQVAEVDIYVLSFCFKLPIHNFKFFFVINQTSDESIRDHFHLQGYNHT